MTLPPYISPFLLVKERFQALKAHSICNAHFYAVSDQRSHFNQARDLLSLQRSILLSCMALLQSLVAERHLTVPRQPQTLLPSNKALWGRITRWRGARGLLKCPSPGLGSQHQACSLRGPFTELPGKLYMCESCGWAHLCGEGCSEKLVDEVSESLVCPISGRCFDRMINEAEVLRDSYFLLQASVKVQA